MEGAGCCPTLRRLAGRHQAPFRPSREEQAALVLEPKEGRQAREFARSHNNHEISSRAQPRPSPPLARAPAPVNQFGNGVYQFPRLNAIPVKYLTQSNTMRVDFGAPSPAASRVSQLESIRY